MTSAEKLEIKKNFIKLSKAIRGDTTQTISKMIDSLRLTAKAERNLRFARIMDIVSLFTIQDLIDLEEAMNEKGS